MKKTGVLTLRKKIIKTYMYLSIKDQHFAQNPRRIFTASFCEDVFYILFFSNTDTKHNTYSQTRRMSREVKKKTEKEGVAQEHREQ
jgi:hypothetical protein